MDKSGSISLDELENWLVECVGEYLPNLDEPIDTNQNLWAYGLDSIVVVALTADVEDRLGIQVDHTVLWDHTTVKQLAKHLLTEREQQDAARKQSINAVNRTGSRPGY